MTDRPSSERKNPWYKEGLSFHCTGCGKCCTGAPGYVWINEKEISAMAKTLGISSEEFICKYTRRVGNKLSLIENQKNYDCVFLKDKKCLVYDARPSQCRTFPFWKENMSSRKSWENLSSYCEGIDHPEASIIPCDLIEKTLNSN
jgi:uncharacterized protein